MPPIRGVQFSAPELCRFSGGIFSNFLHQNRGQVPMTASRTQSNRIMDRHRGQRLDNNVEKYVSALYFRDFETYLSPANGPNWGWM